MSRRPDVQLTTEHERRLEDAHRRLREAVEVYQQHVEQDLGPMQVLADAQAAVEAAEDELWRLRDELLGWSRPSWALSAALVADWFSDEDAVYDTTGSP
jgi:hypothetical protein